MATSKIILYRTSFPRNENILVDGLEQYLQSIAATSHEIRDFQWIRHDLNITIKILMDQSWVDKFPYDYCKIHNDDGNPFFYKVTGSKQIAAGTIQISLEMDVVNSLGQEFDIGHPEQFTDETEIIREHKSRFFGIVKTTEGKSYTYRRVDPTSEGINVDKVMLKEDVILEKINNFTTGDLEEDNQKWHLIYKTKQMTTESQPIVPVSVLMCPDNGTYTINDGNRITPSSIPDDSIYMFLYSENNKDKKVMGITIGSNIQRLYINAVTGDRMLYNCRVDGILVRKNGPQLEYSILYDKENLISGNLIRKYGNNYNFQSTFEPLEKAGNIWNVVPYVEVDEDITDCWYTNKNNYDPTINNEGFPTIKSKVPVGSWDGDSRHKLMYIKGINEIDKTDPLIMKIIQLPYCPSLLTHGKFTGINIISCPGWIANNEGLLEPLENTSIPILSRFLPNTPIEWDDVVEIPTTRNRRQTRDINRESKLLHSDFTPNKLVYDSFSLLIKPETLLLNSTSSQLDRSIYIQYKPSNNMSSNIMFRIVPKNGLINKDSDYSNMFISTRNNEEPLYTSSYINYINTGYNYDKKTNQIQTEATIRNQIIGGIGSAVSIGTSFATGNVLGGVSGIVNATMNAYQSIQNINDAQQLKALNESRKLSELSQQSVNVSSVNDIDLFDEYGHDNKLVNIVYEPNIIEKHKIADFFHFCGYSNPGYGRPYWDNRVNFNFVQVRPHYKSGAMDKYKKDWLQKLSQCYTEGVTVFHRAPDGSYDWERQYENWEDTLCN